MQTLTQTQFQAAFAHGAVQSVALEPVGSQFAVKVTTLTGEASLVQARGTQARLFGTTDAALKLLHKLGVRRIEIESDPYAEGFYHAMGAETVGEVTYESHGVPRRLPLLVYTIGERAERGNIW